LLAYVRRRFLFRDATAQKPERVARSGRIFQEKTMQYRAYLISSVTEVRVEHFSAADDDAAKVHALENVEWGDAQDAQSSETLSLDTDRPEDRIIVVENLDGMTPRKVNGYLELQADKPYSTDARHFLLALANADVHALHLMVEGEPWSLPGIVRRARAICGLPALERPKVKA
jgi:hypothetical protein